MKKVKLSDSLLNIFLNQLANNFSALLLCNISIFDILYMRDYSHMFLFI